MKWELSGEEKKLLAAASLFSGIPEAELSELLEGLGARARAYPKEGIIFHAGDTVREMGLVLEGAVRMEENDVWGRRSIIGSASRGQVFAETYACLGEEPLMVDVIASQPAKILFFDAGRIFALGAGERGGRLVCNLAGVLAEKNLGLTRKIRLITPKSLRERILTYLSQEARQQGSARIVLPFNRQQMADYLNVDRSALSGELSRMQREGLIEYRKNRFLLCSVKV